MSDIHFESSCISVDARLIERSLGVEASRVQSLMREGKITSICERGVDEDAGTYRLTFFHGNCRMRLIVTESGNIIRRSTIDFGSRPSAAALRKRSTRSSGSSTRSTPPSLSGAPRVLVIHGSLESQKHAANPCRDSGEDT
jgi:hypothetical protein